ncbi:MAG: tetratricopeptide repeat protein [Polymorphobacter sp.]|uniref:tetratricopeptide repeat protein n=1 Tax=Polymorphobacter sp. TaxID=1909290 RepID=UPI003A87F6A0
MRFLPGLAWLALVAGPVTGPVFAQDAVVVTREDVQRTDQRLKKLEGEMRAVQRKVFPGASAGAMVAPEIVPPGADGTAAVAGGASNPLVDLTRRVGEMERQLRTLTGQVEANGFKLKQLEDAMTRTRGDVEFRLTRLEGGAPEGGETGPASGPDLGAAGAIVAPEAPAASASVLSPPEASPPVAAPVAPAPGARPGTVVPAVGTAAVAAAVPPEPEPEPGPAVAKGASAADDWQAAYTFALNKDWVQAGAHMAAFTVNWPNSFRMAQAWYWLGRSHAERDQHAEAADAYLKVYNNYPKAGRAPDALIGLAGALIGIGNPAQACRVLDELKSVYPDKMGATRSADAKALAAKAKCG